MKNEPDVMSDAELDALLSLASKPSLPLGAKSRLTAKVNAASRGDTTMGARPKQWRGLVAAVPLAASLALGIYLGREVDSESYLPTSAYELLAGISAQDPLTGIEDAEDLTEGDLS
jgi:hypothetical protein